MFSLQVSDMETARSKLYHWADHIISLLDPDTAADWAQHHDRHLIIGFDDIDADVPDRQAPRADHVAAVLAFGKRIGTDNKVLVHCHAGISRSTATGIGLLISHGETIEAAFEQVRALRGNKFWPNQRLIALFDRQLGLEQALFRHVRSWKLAQFHALKTRSDDLAPVLLDRLAGLPATDDAA